MRESNIESYFSQVVKTLNGLSFKFVSPGTRGVPDRIALLPGGRVVFAEIKAPGKEPGAVQAAVHERIRRLGFEVLVIDSKKGVDDAFRK